MPKTTANPAPVHYEVAAANLQAHLFQVTLTIAQPQAQQTVSLPVWIPGSYLVREFAKNLQQEMYRAVRSTIEETPERKPYLDSVADGKNLDEGDIDLLPDALRSSYGKYESAWEEAMSMRSSGLCHPDDIREQTDIMNGNYKEFREGLREFLGLDKANDASFVREQPTYPNKDWNEQLLAEQKQEETVDETQAREQSPEEEQQTHFRR